jgi:hypothetical protein
MAHSANEVDAQSKQRAEETYLKILRLRDEVFAGRHPRIHIHRDVHLPETQDQTENTHNTESASHTSQAEASTPIFQKIIAAGNRLKRQRAEHEPVENHTSPNLTGGQRLDRTQNPSGAHDGSRIKYEHEQAVGASRYESPSGHREEGEVMEEYDPFEVEFDDETVRGDRLTELEEAYSPPAPAPESDGSDAEEHRLGFKRRKRRQKRRGNHSIDALAEAEMQVCVNQIQSPLAPQPAHISALATDIGQSQFESHGIPNATPRLPKPLDQYEVPPGYRLVPIEVEMEEQAAPTSPDWKSAQVQQTSM